MTASPLERTAPGTPALSVVVPAHDAASTIGAQLEALLGQRWDGSFEVVVVENRCTDATRDVVLAAASRDKRVRLVVADGGSGPSHTRNVGIRAAAATLVACCDADDVVAPGWIAAMADALDSNALVAGALDVDDLNEPWVVEGRGRSITAGPARFGDVAFAHGCNFGVRRQVFLDVGGFDERMRTGEEIDLALRLRSRGVEAHYEPRALVHYRYRADWRGHWRQAFGYGRARPVLTRRLRDAGATTERPRTGRRLLWLARSVPRLRDRGMRMRWLWVAGSLCGAASGRVGRLVVADRARARIG